MAEHFRPAVDTEFDYDSSPDKADYQAAENDRIVFPGRSGEVPGPANKEKENQQGNQRLDEINAFRTQDFAEEGGQDFKAPFDVDPFRTGVGIRENIGFGNSAIFQDPLAGTDLPPEVGLTEALDAEGEGAEKEEEDDEPGFHPD